MSYVPFSQYLLSALLSSSYFERINDDDDDTWVTGKAFHIENLFHLSKVSRGNFCVVGTKVGDVFMGHLVY